MAHRPLTADEVGVFIELAFDRMLAKARELGSLVARRPALDGANSVFVIVIHCVGVTEWWFDHGVLGRPSHRDRDAEFGASGTVEDLERIVGDLRVRLPTLLAEVVATDSPASPELALLSRSERVWPWTTSAMVLHVIEELFQHAGHVDLTADLLRSGGAVVERARGQ